MLKSRNSIPENYKWNIKQYYNTDEDWQKSYDAVTKKFEDIKAFYNNLKNRDNILRCFKLSDEIERELVTLYVYSNMRNDEDLANPKYQQMNNQIQNQLNNYSSMVSFIVPQLCELDDKYLIELSKDKDFSDYDRMLEKLVNEKKHILSEKEERILSETSSFADSFNQTFSNFKNVDLKFNKVKDGKDKEFDFDIVVAKEYLRSPDRELRKNSYNELKNAFGRYNNFLYSNYLSSIKADCFYAKMRNFDGALDKALFYEEIDKQVYDNLIESVNKNLKADFRFFELKRKVLNLDKFAIYDIYYNPIKAPTKKYTYEQAVDLVLKATSVLDKKYTDALTTLINNRCVDVLPNKGKSSGAYSTSAYKKPPMVLLNFTGKYDDVSTLAHEMGHSMHTYFSNSSQPQSKADYTYFLAEIASTVNECLLNRYMLNNAKNNNEKLYYIMEFLSTFHATVFRQTMFAQFEDKMHKLYETNSPLSAQVFNDEYFKLVKKYFGNKVKCPTSSKYEWSSIPHFYRNFYVFKYATGLISAIAIVNNILSKKENAVEDYLKFLSSGSVKDPVSILKMAGVDLYQQKTFDDAFKYINDYLDEFKAIIDKK